MNVIYLDLVPAYVPFIVQAIDPDGVVSDPTVDNLIIYGVPWKKVYLPSVNRDPTPTASPSPTPSTANREMGWIIGQMGHIVKGWVWER